MVKNKCIQVLVSTISDRIRGRSDLKTLQIVEARKSVGVDQRSLAEALEMPAQRLSDIECGHVPIPENFGRRVRESLQEILHRRLNAVSAQ